MHSNIDTLTAAFFDDPVARFLLPSPDSRERWLRLGMRFFHDLAKAGGEVRTIDSGAGVLGVFPPGAYPISLSLVLSTFAKTIGSDFSLKMPVGAAAKFLKMILEFDRRHIKEPHWYVLVIGVRPDRQGRGLSRSLLQPVIDAADAQGVACYLENSNPANLPIYRKFGFDVAEELVPVRGSPKIWLMKRASLKQA